MIEEYENQKDILNEFVIHRKKLLTFRRLMIFLIIVIGLPIINLIIILSSLPTVEQDKMMFLSSFTLFIYAPVVSMVLSFFLALMPIKGASYSDKFWFLTLLILTIIESILLIGSITENYL
jgi:hypothetical protein